jgi:hypothetical protein
MPKRSSTGPSGSPGSVVMSRARRKLIRYLGPDESRWDPRVSDLSYSIG